jgi:carboxylesterase type B
MPSSEDCLYLNVFAPAPTSAEATMDPPSSTLLPVIVFIHGGAFVMGNTQPYGDKGICRHFVRSLFVPLKLSIPLPRLQVLEQNCVFVTIQYRVALFGFFSTGDDACDDNAALWVKI